MEFNDILKQAAELGASDIHLKVGLVPVVRKLGMLRPLNTNSVPISAEQMEKIIQSALTSEEILKLAQNLELDKGLELKGVARFRINVFRQKGSTRFVIRIINQNIPTLEELGLPQSINTITEAERGLVLVTGITGSGKSTTLASMINHINHSKNLHIITLEDPIEYLIKDRKSIISQRELGIDMHSFAESLRATLRQDPDVILVGEMRDKETIETAMLAAETGHLVFSTLHTMDAQETINRIIAQFPPHQHEQIRRQLASVLKAVISQRLLKRKDKNGLVPATEVLVSNQRIREMIEDPDKTSMIHNALETSAKESGMHSFDQSLMRLYSKDIVTLDEALSHATNPDNFKLKAKGIQSGVQSDWNDNIESSSKLKNRWEKGDSKLEIDKKSRL